MPISIPDVLQAIPGRTYKIYFVVAQTFSVTDLLWLIFYVRYLFIYLFVYSLFNNAMSGTDHRKSNGKLIAYNEFERMRK
jgi:hypothetical protein